MSTYRKQLITLNPAQLSWLSSQDANFFNSLKEFHSNKGGITERQYSCLPTHVQTLPDDASPETNFAEAEARTMAHLMEKVEPTPPERTKFKDWDNALHRMQSALESKIQRPKLRLATESGDNYLLAYQPKSDVTWLTYNDEYLGSIRRDGTFYPSKSAPLELEPEIQAELDSMLADLDEELRAYGARTSNCSFCNRKLTHPVSVALGYGPICAENYGLPHSVVEELPLDI